MAELSKIADEAVKKINSKLECSICLENFKEPKLLPCFHIFCESPCLERLMVRDGEGLTLTCPTCRHLVLLPHNGVTGLQTDFHIEHLFEIRQALEKAKNIKCENCSDQNATSYCHDCKVFACDECTEIHNRWKKNAGHMTIGIDEVEADTVGKLSPAKQPLMCDKHPDMEAKIYCETCSDMICNDCTIRLHKDHESDLAKDVIHKHKTELLESLKQLKTNLTTVENALATIDIRTLIVTEQRATVEADIHREIDQLHTLLDQRRVELVASLDMLTQQKLKELTTQRDYVQITQVKMSSCLQYAEAGLETGSESDVLRMKTQVLKRVEQITAEFGPHTLQPQTEANIELVTDDIQRACREFGEVANDPVIPHTSYATGDGTRFAQADKQTSVEVHPITRSNTLFKEPVKLTAEITHTKTNTTIKCDVEQQNDRHTINYRPILKGRHALTIHINGQHIRGSPYSIAVCLSEESLRKPTRVVTDIKPYGTAYNSKQQLIIANRHSKNTITVCADNTKQKIYDMGQEKPSGVAVDHEDNIYITSYSTNCLIKVSPEGNRSDIQCNCPVGIAFNKSNHYLYVCDTQYHKILVLTTQLKLVKKIGKKRNENGQHCDPLNIDFDSANNLFITDHTNNRVQVLTAEGQFLRAFCNKANGETLQYPNSIAIDSSDTVFVSEFYRDCVSVFTARGEYITSFGGAKEGLFDCIFGISIGEDDSIVVSDTNHSRLQIFYNCL